MPLRPSVISITTTAAAQLVADGEVVDPTMDIIIRADALAAALRACSSSGAQDVADQINDAARKRALLTVAAAVAARRG